MVSAFCEKNLHMFKRNQAFSMDLSESLKESDGRIRELLSVQGKLYAITEHRIIEILTATSIDPENKEPETLHHHQIRYKVGSSDPAVARTILMAKSVVKSVSLSNSLDENEILDHTWDCTCLLIKCSLALRSLHEESGDLITKCDELITKAKEGKSIPSLPQVDDLEEKIVTFLGYAKRFLEKTHELMCLFYGIKNQKANFGAYRDWAEKHQPNGSNLFKYLDSHKDWIQHLAWSRNALDINHSRPGFNVSVHNFKVMPGNKFTNLGWVYDFTDRGGDKGNEPSDLLHDMMFYMNQMTALFEAIFLQGIADSWDSVFKFQIYKIPEDKIDPECPILYEVSIDPKFLKTEAEPSA